MRGDSLLAVVEASLDAGLDVRTITAGVGYSRPEYLRRAVLAAGGDHLEQHLRIRARRGKSVVIEEVQEMLDTGMTASHVCEVLERCPKRLGDLLKDAGDPRHKAFSRHYNMHYRNKRG